MQIPTLDLKAPVYAKTIRPVRHVDRPRIFLAGRLTALESPGGGEVHMQSLASALRVLEVQASLWRPWEDPLAECHCLHLFGSLPEHQPLIQAARRQGVAVVLSTAAWLGPDNGKRATWSARFKRQAASLAQTTCSWMPSWRRKLYHSVDLLLPNSHAEAKQLSQLFGVPNQQIHIVPKGADPRFAEADPQPFRDLVGTDDFVLCVGRIEPRKNQIALLRAMQGTGIPVVVLGDVAPGYESYFDACRRTGGKDVIFVPRLDHGDPLLASAYTASQCLAMCSWFETPGLAALEASMSGTPLVLPEGGCAEEYFGNLAHYVRPDDIDGIRRAVSAAIEQGRSPILAEHVRHYLTWETAARITCEAYERALGRPVLLAEDNRS